MAASTLTVSALALGILLSNPVTAKTVVFWQDGFPVVSSQPVGKQTLTAALGGDVAFLNLAELSNPNALAGADLLVLPYGSAFPADNWNTIHAFLQRSGNLLVLGGQPLRVPVSFSNNVFSAGLPEDAYSRALGILHSYEAPQQDGVHFAWKDGYSFLPFLKLEPEHVFVLESRRLDGLGYMVNQSGEKVSAPVVVAGGREARWVFLDFQPSPGYWDSKDGTALVGAAAAYARRSAESFSLEVEFSTVKPGETPLVFVRFRNALQEGDTAPHAGEVQVELLAANRVILKRNVDFTNDATGNGLALPASLAPGFYLLRGTYSEAAKPCEFYQNGFWVEDQTLLSSGPELGIQADFLTEDGRPFFPFGTNYFSTEENGWDFSGPRNAAVWERDFADMEKHGVTFVRTGVWGGQFKISDGPGEGVSERFLRNLEAYLLCAGRHHIAVNFTFFAFDPQSTLRASQNPVMLLPGSNPYLDPVTIRAEQDYILSIVRRFKNVPYLSWDLINEPSFSNPRALWHGNTPDNDPAEVKAWHTWLREHYKSLQQLASEWSVSPDQLGSFDSVPLPAARDLQPDLESGDFGMARAYDYNLFAQDSFSHWVRTMVSAIRATGSRQLIDVGQDEGGVENRVLNQFYAHSGLAFTTNHTYRQNQSLLWDSLVSKAPGIANIVGETGYQPITYPNGDWHFDELTGFALIERKWAAGFAAGTSGALSWDWDREIYFGMERSDGSAKVWEEAMKEMGDFARKAAPYATSFERPEVAIVLPESLQLSVFSRQAIEAEQNCVRALYGYARSSAFAVGEHQIALLGHPKLIIVPSPWVFDSKAWQGIVAAVRDGSTLLVSGRFDLDPHFLPTQRQESVDIPYQPCLLDTLVNHFKWPEGAADLVYGSGKTDYLQRAALHDGATFAEKPLGKGKILFAAFPLELSDNLQAIGDVYRYALKAAGVSAVYSTSVNNPGVLICPTRFPHATLYVISSQTETQDVSFRDEKSGKQISAPLAFNRAALLLIEESGRIAAAYNWK